MSVEVHGYAIVSDDDRIADARGQMPEALRNDADWAYFQSELDRADLVAIGRASHVATPNVKRRRRLVISRAAVGLERREDALWWNPLERSWASVAEEFLPRGGRVGVPGGQAAFDLFLGVGYAGFHLSRAEGVTLPGGRGLFAACEDGTDAEALLSGAGLRAGPRIEMDAAARVSMVVWTG